MQHHRDQGGSMVGAFLAGAATALLAGGYFLYGPNGRQHRKQVESWINDAKEEILDKFEEAKDATQKTYDGIVDEVMEKYAALRDIGEEKASEVGNDFKARFKEMKSEIRKLKKELEEVR